MRVVPWFVDGARDFLDGWMTSRKNRLARHAQIEVLEFGAGSSTLFFLERGCRVSSVEHNPTWASRVDSAANAFGLQENLRLLLSPRPYDNVLGEEAGDYDLLAIDGRDRVQCLETNIHRLKASGLLVFDNTERIAGRYSRLLDLLGDFSCIHFEQPRIVGRSGSSSGVTSRDYAGYVVRHRWLTTVAWRRQSLENYSTQGFPLLQATVHEAK